MTHWPAWATETVEVRPPDAAWGQAGERKRQLLEASLPWLVDRVEHVGSSAVPGLAAKPILDLQALVADPGPSGVRSLGEYLGDAEN